MGRSFANPVALMLAAAWAFSVMGACTRLLSPSCDWAFVAFVRSVVALTVAVSLARPGNVPLVWWAGRLWLRSLAGGISLACSFYATARLPLADSTALFCINPLWVVLLMGLGRRQIPSFSDVVAVTCGCVGIWLILGPGLVGLDLDAVIVAIAGSVMAAISFIGLHRLYDFDPRAVLAHFSAVSCGVTGVCWLAGSAGQTVRDGWVTVVPLLVAVGLAGAAGQLLQTRAFALGRPQIIAVVGLSQVLFGVVFDVLFWSRRPSLIEITGFGLTMTATAWVYLRGANKVRAINQQA